MLKIIMNYTVGNFIKDRSYTPDRIGYFNPREKEALCAVMFDSSRQLYTLLKEDDFYIKVLKHE